MNVLIVIGPFSMIVHYRALQSDGQATIKWDTKSAHKRLADGTRIELDQYEIGCLEEKLSPNINEAILNHYLSPDEFEYWLKTQDIEDKLIDGGMMTFEHAIELARAAFGAAHEIK